MRNAPLLLLALASLLPSALAAEKMTPEVTVSAADVYEHAPSVAYNSVRDEYLVVWHDDDYDASPRLRLWARRLDRYGRPLGDRFEPAPTADGRSRKDAAVAYDSTGDRYLLVYALDWLGDGSDHDIRGRYLAWDGVDPAWTEFTIAGSTLNEWSPEVSFSPASERFLVAWSRWDPVQGGVVWGAHFALGGTPNPFELGAPGYRLGPDLAFDGSTNRFLLVYDSLADVLARGVEAATGAVGAERVASTPATNERQAAVASCGGAQALVAWMLRYGENDEDIVARFLLGDGAPDGVEFAAGATTGNETEAAVACLAGGQEYLLAWRQEWFGSIYGLAARRVSSAKVYHPAFDLVVPDTDLDRDNSVPATAGGAAGWLVVWEKERSAGPSAWHDIHARVVWELFADGFEWGTTDSWSAVTH
jgi:hypothetical protein